MPLVKNNEARVHNLGGHLTLGPGVNNPDPKAWAEAKKIKLVQHHLEEGTFEELDVKDLAQVSEKRAAKLVADTVDRELLKSWAASEKREKVKAAIVKQLEKINPGQKKDEDEADE
jgi:hypothetical protein